MKYLRNIIVVILILVMVVLSLASWQAEKTLADLYKTGAIRLIPEVTLDENTLPNDTFLESVVDMAIDPEGNLYVCDYQAHDVKIINSSGKYLKSIGRAGQGPGEFQMPFNLTITKERLLVWELRNRRLSVLTNKGEHLKAVQVQMSDGWPRKLGSLPNGDFLIEKVRTYFGDNEKPQECHIEIFSPDLELKKSMYNTNFWENKYITKPQRTNVPIPYSPKVHWDVSQDGKIIIGYSEKFFIEIYDHSGRRVSQFEHKFNPVKVTDKDKERWFADMTTGTSAGGTTQGAPDFIKKNTKFPKFKPAFHNLIVDGEGNILVFCHQKDSADDSRLFSAFDPDGDFIGDVRIQEDPSLPINFFRACFSRKSVWVLEFTADEIATVRKYKISE